MSIAEIIAGSARKLAVECSLDELMLLGHFTAAFDEKLVGRLIEKHSAKEIICGDYAGCIEQDFRQEDIIYACCRRLMQKSSAGGKIAKRTAVPGAEDYLAAEAYMNSLSTDFAKSLSQRAKSIGELKAVMLADEIYARHGDFKADYSLPPHRLALEMARRLCSRKKSGPGEENGRLNEILYGGAPNGWKKKVWKKRLAAAAIIASLGFAAFKAESCYTDWKKADAVQYNENKKMVAECESLLSAEDYRAASACNDRLMQGIEDSGWLSQSKKLDDKAESLEARIQKKLNLHYSARLRQVREGMRRGDYTGALRLSSGIIAELNGMDYYNDADAKLKEAEELERIIEKRIEESGTKADEARGIFERAYSGIKGLYMWMGLGETASDAASVATLLLPVSFAIRRVFRRLRG